MPLRFAVVMSLATAAVIGALGMARGDDYGSHGAPTLTTQYAQSWPSYQTQRDPARGTDYRVDARQDPAAFDGYQAMLESVEARQPPTRVAWKDTSHTRSSGGSYTKQPDSSGDIVFEVEALFVAVHRSDGSRVGLDLVDNVEPAWDVTPRVTFGYATPSGTGMRARWWDYNHSQRTSSRDITEGLGVHAFTLDLETFDTVCLGDHWQLELFGGIRWTGFREHMFDGGEFRANNTKGGGGIVGAEARREVGSGYIFGRIRAGVTYTLKERINTNSGFESFDDAVYNSVEVALGCARQHVFSNGTQVYVRTSTEWHSWMNVTSDFDTGDAGTWTGHSDAGFAMVGFSAGVIY